MVLQNIPHVARPRVSIFLVAIISIAALWLNRFGIPAILSALLLGIAFNTVLGEIVEHSWIETLTAPLLKFGIALLGLRLTYADATALGAERAIIIGAISLSSLPTGILIARLLGLSDRTGLLAGIGTAICGATAILAFAAARLVDTRKQCEIGALCLGLVILSTIAMLVLPALVLMLGLTDAQAGFFIGGSIQNVPQAVGAGFAVSIRAGEIATLTKMFRVSMLIPVLLLSAFLLPTGKGALGILRASVPVYLLLFICFALVGSFATVPDEIRNISALLSNGLLVVGIAAIGLMTSIKAFFATSGPILLLLVLNAAALCLMILGAIHADLL